MILCEWDASEGHPGQSCVHLFARILSTSFISVSIFSVWCYSSVLYLNGFISTNICTLWVVPSKTVRCTMYIREKPYSRGLAVIGIRPAWLHGLIFTVMLSAKITFVANHA